MTEKSGKKKATHTRYVIDPVIFFLAFVGAPLLVTLATFWMLFIPVVALVMGGPVYLALGVPVLLWWLGRAEPKVGDIAALAFAANLVVCGLAWVVSGLALERDYVNWPTTYLVFGSIFAPIWGGTFALLYRTWRRPVFAKPVTY